MWWGDLKAADERGFTVVQNARDLNIDGSDRSHWLPTARQSWSNRLCNGMADRLPLPSISSKHWQGHRTVMSHQVVFAHMETSAERHSMVYSNAFLSFWDKHRTQGINTAVYTCSFPMDDIYTILLKHQVAVSRNPSKWNIDICWHRSNGVVTRDYDLLMINNRVQLVMHSFSTWMSILCAFMIARSH